MKYCLACLVFFSIVLSAHPFSPLNDSLENNALFSWKDYLWLGKIEHDNQVLLIFQSKNGDLLNLSLGDRLGYENARIKSVSADQLEIELPLSAVSEYLAFYGGRQ